MRLLVLGDPHVVVDELPECERLGAKVLGLMEDHNAGLVVLGDLYNNHSVVRVEVMAFWRDFFHKARHLSEEVFALVGNHDRPQGSASGIHSLMAHHDVYVVDRPISYNGVGFMPYFDSPERWIEEFKDLGTKVVFCHQTFAGSKYENGFFAPGGVPTEVLGDTKIISGHIHTPQTVGNVWYPGAPRWRSISDAGVDRFIYLIDVNSQGYKVLDRFSTADVCTPITLVNVETMEQLAEIPKVPGVRVTLTGSESFLKEAEATLQSMGVRYRSSVVGRATSVRESEGVDKAFAAFVRGFDAPGKTPSGVLLDLAATRVR